MGPLGMPELIVIFVIALLVFGPRKLPELGRSLGKSLGEFKRASNELRSTLEEEVRIEEQREATQRVNTPAPVETPSGPRAVETPAPDAHASHGQVSDDITPRAAHDTTPRSVTAD